MNCTLICLEAWLPWYLVAFSPAFSFHGEVNFAGNWGANVIGRYSPYIKYLPRYFDRPLIKEPCIRPSLFACSQKDWLYDCLYPGYQRFFSREAGIFGGFSVLAEGRHVFGRRPKPRAAKPREKRVTIKTWQKPETTLEKSLAPRVDCLKL